MPKIAKIEQIIIVLVILFFMTVNQETEKKGRECDLDRSFVDNMMKMPCNYCGMTSESAKMTLDRIDNDIGHLKTNVVTACYRCNLIRGDMPYSAWELLVPVIKTMVPSGAFGEWKLHPNNRRAIINEELESIAELVEKPTTQNGGHQQKISDEDYIKALQNNASICSALRELGIAAKGGNYTRAKRLLGYSDDVRLNTNGKPIC